MIATHVTQTRHVAATVWENMNVTACLKCLFGHAKGQEEEQLQPCPMEYMRVYVQCSKLANVLFTYELQKRWGDSGVQVSSQLSMRLRPDN